MTRWRGRGHGGDTTGRQEGPSGGSSRNAVVSANSACHGKQQPGHGGGGRSDTGQDGHAAGQEGHGRAARSVGVGRRRGSGGGRRRVRRGGDPTATRSASMAWHGSAGKGRARPGSARHTTRPPRGIREGGHRAAAQRSLPAGWHVAKRSLTPETNTYLPIGLEDHKTKVRHRAMDSRGARVRASFFRPCHRLDPNGRHSPVRGGAVEKNKL